MAGKTKQAVQFNTDENKIEHKSLPNEKDLAVIALRKAGLMAYNDNGVVMCTYASGDEYEHVKEMQVNILNSIKFKGSFGIRYASGSNRVSTVLMENAQMQNEEIYEKNE